MELLQQILEKFSKEGIAYLLLVIVLYGVYKIIMKLLDVILKEKNTTNEK